VVIEGILGSKCRKGATATVTGTVKRFAEALEIDPGGGASSSCR
jgi:hypothetical protein